MWHGYILISELPPGWTNEDRQTAWQALRGAGRQSGDNPAEINHSRLSLDGTALIIEALFDDDEITRPAIVATIADALSVNPTAVDAKIDYSVFSAGGTHEESRAACVAYLATNAADWEPSEA